MLWYQGENDETHADIYDVVLKNLIRCWRDLWREELPFLIVQLAPFEYWTEEGRMIFPTIREKQEWVSNHVPEVWMASIMDVGMKKDIHPKQKKPVGERLALLAEGHVYGKHMLCDAPECVDMVVDHEKVTLTFANAGDGLKVSGNMLQAAELLVDGKQVEEFSFGVHQNLLEIRSEEIRKEEVEIRFARKDYCEVNLFNSIGLPAKPFYRKSCFMGNKSF